jgi:hypothetical protein
VDWISGWGSVAGLSELGNGLPFRRGISWQPSDCYFLRMDLCWVLCYTNTPRVFLGSEMCTSHGVCLLRNVQKTAIICSYLNRDSYVEYEYLNKYLVRNRMCRTVQKHDVHRFHQQFSGSKWKGALSPGLCVCTNLCLHVRCADMYGRVTLFLFSLKFILQRPCLVSFYFSSRGA